MSTSALQFDLNFALVEHDDMLIQENQFNVGSVSGNIDLLINFDLIQKDSDEQHSVSLNFIKNNDGSIRWIWPAHNSKPTFLAFYSLGNWKSRVFAILAKLAFIFGLGRFFKQGTISFQGFSFTKLAKSNWAIFTGTIGPNRKAILCIGSKNDSRFVKHPFSEHAKNNLQKEQSALFYLKDSGAAKYFHFPAVIEESKSTLFAQSALPVHAIRASTLPHQLNLNQFIAWQESSLSNNTLEILRIDYSESRFSQSLIIKIYQLNQWCELNRVYSATCNHGDFTPWNCKMLSNDLYIFDWEMFKEKGLPLEDLFHFVYQQAILVDRISFIELRNRISQLLNQTEVSDFIQRHKLDALTLELHYLQRTCAYYLDVYSRQENWHIQVNWLLSKWEESIEYLLKITEGDIRKEVLRDFQSASTIYNFALLKFNLQLLEDLPVNSDLDLCTTYKSAVGIRKYFENHRLVFKVRFKNLLKMHQLEVILIDGSRIDIDLIFQFRRKWLDYLDASLVLKSKVLSSNGLQLANDEANALYVQRFYALNGSEIPEKHLHWISSSPTITSVKEVNKVVNRLPQNRGMNNFINRINYFREMIMSMNKDRGFLITFSGVDGAGKSTIIDAIRNELEKAHRRRVVVIRHRPSLLPIISALKYGKKGAEQRSVATLPRQGKNGSKVSSLFRFVYYLSDYVFGQWWIHFRYVRKGVVVLYDRYYFDFINDSRRSNIALSPSFTERFYGLIRKPEFNFFLWAPSGVILKRKQELDKESIEGLTTQYTELFDRLQRRDSKSVYRCIENLEIGETVELIMRNVDKKLHESPVYPNHPPAKP